MENTKLFQTEYYEPIEVDKQGNVSFWMSSEAIATQGNCEKLDLWKSQGLGAAIEKEVLLNLANLELFKNGETRCSPSQ
jgi:hypothetical protein